MLEMFSKRKEALNPQFAPKFYKVPEEPRGVLGLVSGHRESGVRAYFHRLVGSEPDGAVRECEKVLARQGSGFNVVCDAPQAAGHFISFVVAVEVLAANPHQRNLYHFTHTDPSSPRMRYLRWWVCCQRATCLKFSPPPAAFVLPF
ncbi:hypothetical protein [Micromonospora sp. NPDC002717]|uniref:hypothetical protein n=1 Tax=Micromonospora sp. NPDC002717 TaxID=3154424 RepID=UPI003322C816